MKNRIRTLAALVLSVLMVMTFMTGCSSKPTADDAKAYVKATMDLMCTGDYDHSVKLADVEEGNETAIATEGEEGGFDVTVSVEPLKMFDGATAAFQEQMPDITGHSMAELQAMSETELNNVLYKALFGFISDRLDSPTYADPVEVVVHYGILDEEQNMYGCSEAEGEKLGEKLITLEGM